MNQYIKLKWYLQTWFIALLIALWFLLLPPIIGLILLSVQKKYLDRASEIMTAYGGIDEIEKRQNHLESSLEKRKREIDEYLDVAKSEADEELESFKASCKNDRRKLESTLKKLRFTIKEMKDEKSSLVDEIQIIHYDFSSYDGLSSQECKNQLAILKNRTKELISSNRAIVGDISNKEGKSNAKQIIRLFNAECDNVIINLKVGKVDAARAKITKSFESINKIFAVDGVKLSNKVLENKLEELNLVYTYSLKADQEKAIQKAIKEQMIEEEKARREIEAAKKKIEKDENQFNGEIKRLLAYLQKTDSEVEKQLYMDKIHDLEAKLTDLQEMKETVEAREANATAGYVYVISNIGSFGKDIYKIGMTRRLEPMDRVKELSSASVPFSFDVHAMIFSEDAPKLESTLHERFKNQSVNKVNYRKEFFNVSLADVEAVVKNEFNSTTEFTQIPVANEYRETMRINSMLNEA